MQPRNRQEQIHWDHQIDFQKHLTKPRYKSSNSPELKTRIQCVRCNVYVKWPCADEIRYWDKHKNKRFTLNTWIHEFMHMAPKSSYWEPKPIDGHDIVWLTVTYKDKDKVKKYGAKWYQPTSQWYTYTNNNKLEHLLPWIQEPNLTRLAEFLSVQGNYKAYE